MKKILVPLAVVLLLALATPAFAEWELGLSWIPLGANSYASDLEYNFIPGFHVGYGFWYVGYASWDAFALPDFMTYNVTGNYYTPSFLNLWDVGLRLVIGPVLGFAEIGVNNLWVYSVGLMNAEGVGANIRLGVGAKFNWWGITVAGTSVYSSFGRAAETIGGLFSGEATIRNASLTSITGGLIWSIGLNFYLR